MAMMGLGRYQVKLIMKHMYLSFFDNHDIVAPIYSHNIHSDAKLDIAPPSSEVGVDSPPHFLNTQSSKIGKKINSDTSDSDASETDHSEKGSDVDLDDLNVSEDTQDIANNVEILLERSHHVSFKVDDLRPYFGWE